MAYVTFITRVVELVTVPRGTAVSRKRRHQCANELESPTKVATWR